MNADLLTQWAETAVSEGRLLDAARLFRMDSARRGLAESLRRAEECESADRVARELEPAVPFRGPVVRYVVASLNDRDKAERLLSACAAAAVCPLAVIRSSSGLLERSGLVESFSQAVGCS